VHRNTGRINRKKYNINGWCRISVNWTNTDKEIDFILNSLKYIAENYEKYLDQYIFDQSSNLYMKKIDK